MRLEKEIERAHEKGWRQEYPSKLSFICGNKLVLPPSQYIATYDGSHPRLLYIGTEGVVVKGLSDLLIGLLPAFFPCNMEEFYYSYSLTNSILTLHELFNKKRLLSTQDERQRRLAEVPEAIPDTEESKRDEFGVAASNHLEENKGSKP